METAFGLLKGRWRFFLKRLDNNLDYVPFTILACCILHNICPIKFAEDESELNAIIEKSR